MHKQHNDLQNAIQIAGVIDHAEADLLIAEGITFLGFPLRLKDGREDLLEAQAADIIGSLPTGVHAVCITYLDDAAEIIALCDSLNVHWVQLHGNITLKQLTRLRTARPRLSIIKSLIVRDQNLQTLKHEIESCAMHIDAFITDTFDPATGRSGATGLTHDWSVSRRIVELSPKPVILAGGLNPANVEQAIQAVKPAAVDVHTGVEGTDGRKDPEKVRQFVAGARRGFL